jgi:hypothetical protein
MESPLFFLAGPIRGGGDWQAKMAEQILYQEPHANIACPSRWDDKHRLAHLFYRPFSQTPNRQLVWERHYIKKAGLEKRVRGCIIVWLGLEDATDPHTGPEPYAMDTRREVGKLTAYAEMMEVRMVFGGDLDFYGLDVILFELGEATEKPFPFYTSMDDVVEQARIIAKQ